MYYPRYTAFSAEILTKCYGILSNLGIELKMGSTLHGKSNWKLKIKHLNQPGWLWM